MSLFEKNFWEPLEKSSSKKAMEKKLEEKLFDSSPEKNPKIELLDQRTLAFVKEHIDILKLGQFNPEEELKEIKKIYNAVNEGQRHETKQVLMENFKQKLAEFRKNMSLAQLDLETFLRTNPDISQKEMLTKIDAMLDQYHLQSQKEHFYQAIRKFREVRQSIQKVVKQYQEQFADRWPGELFKKLFGQFPNGHFTVDILPLSLYFKINDLADYTLAAREQGRSPHQISGGIRLTYSLSIKELTGKVILENYSIDKDPDFAAVKRIHEAEHAIHDLYPEATFIAGRGRLDHFFEQTGEVDLKTLRQSLENSAKLYLDVWEETAKSEILAYLKDGQDGRRIRDVLLEDNGFYDFLNNSAASDFADNAVRMWEKQKHHLKIKKKNGLEINADELRAESRAIIRAMGEHYHGHVYKAMEQVIGLLEKYGEAQRPAVLRLLSQEPLNKWHRLNKLLSL